MPRYFFHIHNGHEMLDDVGTELPGLDEARAHAVRYAGDVLSASAKQFWKVPELRLEAVDESNRIRFALHLIGLDRPVVAATPDAEACKL